MCTGAKASQGAVFETGIITEDFQEKKGSVISDASEMKRIKNRPGSLGVL